MFHVCLHTSSVSVENSNTVALDRDIALTIGWIQSVLHSAILQLPDSVVCMSEKIEAVMAINKVLLP